MYTALIVLKNSNNLMYNKNQLDTRVGLPPWKFDHSPQILLSLPLANSPKKPHFMALTTITDPAVVIDRTKQKISEQRKVLIKSALPFRLKSNFLNTEKTS